MRYSFSSVYMAIIASNILLILLTFVFRRQKSMVNIGYRLLAIFLVMTLVRFLLPFEMAFSKTVGLPEWISAPLTWVRHPWFSIGKQDITIWLFLQIIWGIGFVVKLVTYIRLQCRDRYYFLSHMWDVTHTEPYQSILDEICEERKRKNVFGVAEVAGLKIPLLYGVMKPYILLPKNHSISEQDLYYVLAHEASHHFHHDLIVKFLVQLIDMVYWWNPFCRILTRQTDTILEMRIDDAIANDGTHTIQDYLHCLLHLKESATEADPVSHISSMPLFAFNGNEQDTDLEKRFIMLTASNHKKKHFRNIILLLLVLGLYFSSYTFIYEADYSRPEFIEDTFSPSDAGMYAILKEDGTYDIYFEKYLLENTGSLEFYVGIKIYTEQEIKNEKH